MRNIHSMYTRNYACWGPGGYVSNAAYAQPESAYWQEQAATFKGLLHRTVGDDVFLAWAELTWPGDTIQACTWQQIARANEAAYRAAHAGQLDPQLLAQISQERMNPKEPS